MSKREQRTICEACGNSNLEASSAVWTDDGTAFCPKCAPPTDNLEAGAGDLVERRVELITNALLHLPIRGAELQFAARQVELALRPEMEKAMEAERQACASIARGHAGVDKSSSARFLAHNIASAILARAALSQEAPK